MSDFKDITDAAQANALEAKTAKLDT